MIAGSPIASTPIAAGAFGSPVVVVVTGAFGTGQVGTVAISAGATAATTGVFGMICPVKGIT